MITERELKEMLAAVIDLGSKLSKLKGVMPEHTYNALECKLRNYGEALIVVSGMCPELFSADEVVAKGGHEDILQHALHGLFSGGGKIPKSDKPSSDLATIHKMFARFTPPAILESMVERMDEMSDEAVALFKERGLKGDSKDASGPDSDVAPHGQSSPGKEGDENFSQAWYKLVQKAGDDSRRN